MNKYPKGIHTTKMQSHGAGMKAQRYTLTWVSQLEQWPEWCSWSIFCSIKYSLIQQTSSVGISLPLEGSVPGTASKSSLTPVILSIQVFVHQTPESQKIVENYRTGKDCCLRICGFYSSGLCLADHFKRAYSKLLCFFLLLSRDSQTARGKVLREICCHRS